MPQVGFELTIQVFKWAKTFHVLGHAATVIGHEGIIGFIKRGFVIRLRVVR
jgi:hypothetical protein